MNRIEIPIKFILAAATTFFLFLSGLAIPLAGILMIPLVPQPSLAFGVKYGRGPGFAILFTVSLLLFLFGGREVTVGFLLLALMVGWQRSLLIDLKKSSRIYTVRRSSWRNGEIGIWLIPFRRRVVGTIASCSTAPPLGS